MNKPPELGDRPLRLLVARDNPDAIGPMLGRFATHALEMTEVRCADRALAAVREDRPDLILLDDSIADGDIFDLSRTLRQIMGEGICPILLTLSSDKEFRLEEIQDWEELGFLFKPLHVRDVEREMSHLLAISSLKKRLNRTAAVPNLSASTRSSMLPVDDAIFDLAMSATETGIWDWDVLANHFAWSGQLEIVFGYAVGSFDGSYQSYYDLVHPEDRELLSEAYARALDRPDRPFYVEHRIIRPDGQERWLECKGKVFIGADKKPARMIGVYADITERRRLNQELVQSEQRYRNLVENLEGSATILFDKELRIVLADGPEIGAVGFARDHVLGKTIDDLPLPPELLERARNNMEAALAGQSHSVTLPLGEAIYNFSYVPLIGDEEAINFGIIIVRNITEQIEAVEAWRENERWLKTIISHNPVVLFALDQEGVVTLAEGKGLRNLQLTPEAIVGQSIFDYYRDFPSFLEMTRRALRGERLHDLIHIGPFAFDVYYAPLEKNGVQEGVIGVLTDVSIRVAAEEALRDSEARYSAVVNRALDGIVILQDGVIQFANEAAKRLLQYEAFDVVGEHMSRFLAPEVLETVSNRVSARLRGEDVPSLYQTILVRRDGSKVNVELSASLIQFDGQPAILGVVRDISERMKTEEARRISEEKFFKAFHASPDSVTITTVADGTLLEVNEGFERIFGYTREEVAGRNSPSLNLYAFPEDRMRMIDRLLRDGRVHEMELVGRSKTGELRTCLVSAEPIQIGDESCLVTIVRDITETREAETALRVSEKRYRLLAENLPNSFILLLDDRMRTLIADGPELEKLSLDKANLEGEVLLAPLLTPVKEFVEKIFQDPHAADHISAEIVLGEMTYSVNFVPLDDVTDEIGAVMVLAQNVTEWKKAEKSRQVAEILRVELEKEREMRNLKSQFVSMIVHDFRNPVSVIQVSLHMFLKYYERLDREKRTLRLQAMLEQTTLLNQLIDDVLMIGQMEIAKNDFAPQNQDLILFAEEIYQEFIQGIDLHKFHLVFEDHSEALQTWFDPALLKRALLNLLGNAIKYSPEGGEIRFSVLDSVDSAIISIADEGIGIPPEHMDRLFEGFYRANNVGSIQGSGLGLAIVKQIVDVHQGEIYCESKLNQGTIFTIKLPHGGAVVPLEPRLSAEDGPDEVQ